MNKLNLPILIPAGLACLLITTTIVFTQSVQTDQLQGAITYLLLMVAALLLALFAGAMTIHQKLQAEIAAREDFAQQLQQLNAQLEQRVEQRTAEVRRLSLAIEQTPASVVLTDRNAKIEYINPSFVTKTGYSAAEVIGQTPRILQSGVHTPEFFAQMWQTLTSGEVWRGKMCNRRKNGERFWEDTSIAPIVDDSGEITHYVAVKIDVTEQAAREQALAESEARCRTLFESTNDAIMILDEIAYRDGNQAAINLFDFDDRETLCQYHPVDVSPATQPCGTSSRQLAQQYYDTAMRDGRCRFEWVHQRRDGERFEADVLYSAVTLDGRQVIECSVRDITVRKKAEQSLQAAKAAAEEATRAKSEFLASMSHELRTPLNGVIGMMELLAGTELTQQQRQFADACRHSGESLLYLINDILDFSKIEAGKLELDLHDFDLEKLITETVETLVWRAADQGVEMPCYVDQVSRLIVKGDSNRLRQVLVNLLGNAIKFTQAGEVAVHTHIVARQQDRITIRFSVADTGIGIPADKLARLFQSFSQVDASTTRTYGGTGLGLTISQSLVELMGGAIEVESEAGVGSRFWFEVSLPVVSESTNDIPAFPPPADRRILIVDDNPTYRSILTQYADDWGLTAVTACSVDEAFAALDQAETDDTAFDLVLTDYTMPARDGLELARALKQYPVRVVLLLGSTDVQLNDQRLAEHGVDATLRKPFRRQELYDVLYGVLAGGESPPPIGEAGKPSTSRNVSVPTARVLLAEDNKINQMYMIELLKQLGIDCDTVGTGRDACEAVKQHAYDLVLMDCLMPEMDGFEATQRIRRWETDAVLPGHLPIIALTALAVKGDRRRCLDAGMDEYLSKPVQRAQIVDMFTQFLGNTETPPTAPIDGESLLARCFHNIDFAFTLLDELQSTGNDRVQKIRQHAEQYDAAATADAAHSLKGAMGILCAESVQKLAASIEQAGRQENVEELSDTLDQLEAEMHRCLEFVPQLREDLQASREPAAARPTETNR